MITLDVKITVELNSVIITVGATKMAKENGGNARIGRMNRDDVLKVERNKHETINRRKNAKEANKVE